jgi:hypothetical protein
MDKDKMTIKSGIDSFAAKMKAHVDMCADNMLEIPDLDYYREAIVKDCFLTWSNNLGGMTIDREIGDLTILGCGIAMLVLKLEHERQK